MIIRTARLDDAEQLLLLRLQLDNETQFMLLEPGERHNDLEEPGIALYKKQGFEIEGTRKHAYIINGQYVDEYYMGKILY